MKKNPVTSIPDQTLEDPREAKLALIQEAIKCSFPTADIKQMNLEIERGYSSDLPR